MATENTPVLPAVVVPDEARQPDRPGTALVPGGRENVLSLALLSEEEFERRLRATKLGAERATRIIKEMLTKDEDYGTIPGTKKPSLYLAGAQKLCKLFGLVATYRIRRYIGDGATAPHIGFRVRVDLHLGDSRGPVVGVGIGAANSWQEKYRWRRGQRACPLCGVEGSIFKSKKTGWYCAGKAGGCWAEFQPEDPRIVKQPVGPVENQNPHALENTLLKMAKKCGLVDAALMVTGMSGALTQDTEDLPRGLLGAHSSDEPDDAVPQDEERAAECPACMSVKVAPSEPGMMKCQECKQEWRVGAPKAAAAPQPVSPPPAPVRRPAVATVDPSRRETPPCPKCGSAAGVQESQYGGFYCRSCKKGFK